MKLKIGTYQMNIAWENTQENMDKINGLINSNEIDLLVLPEMFNTGFSMNPEKVAIESNVFINELKTISRNNNVALCGSFAAKSSKGMSNRMFFVDGDNITTYDKRHLFRMAKEQDHYLEGNEQVMTEFKGFKIALNVCYDLRFPVWSRRTKEFNYDALIYVANWPKVRSDAWYSLLKARAIENLSYCIGVNRVGVDGSKVEYDGKSAVFDYVGKEISNHNLNQEELIITIISKSDLETFRNKFPAHLDADLFDIRL